MNPDQAADVVGEQRSLVDANRIIDSLNPNAPEVFRMQARQVAVFIASLDQGDGLDDPNIQRFIKQLRESGYIRRAQGSVRQHSLDPRTVFPLWLQTELLEKHGLVKPKSWYLGADQRKIADQKYDQWIEGRRLSFENSIRPGATGRYDRLTQSGIKARAPRQFKLYVEQKDILDSLESGALSNVADQLAEHNLPPEMMKLFDSDNLVIYFSQDIDVAGDVEKIFQENGLPYRGPAQDVRTVTITKDDGVQVQSGGSNDNALDPARELFGRSYDVSGYDPQKFLESYLSLCFKAGKNPAVPYLTSFVYLNDYNGAHKDQKDEFVQKAEVAAGYPILYNAPVFDPNYIPPPPRRVS